MAEMNTNTAELLQQMIDIKKDTRAAIEEKGVSVFGGMVTYPEAISRIVVGYDEGSIDYTRAGWTSENSVEQNEENRLAAIDGLDYAILLKERC